MEGFKYRPPEADTFKRPGTTPENPHGTGKLEANDSGEIETREGEEVKDAKEKQVKLLLLAALIEIIKNIKSVELRKQLWAYLISLLNKQK